MTKQNKKPARWAAKVDPKIKDFENIVFDIVYYMELTKAVIMKFATDKKFPQALMFKLKVEGDFCLNILKNIFELVPSYVAKISQAMTTDEGWSKEVDEFGEKVWPEEKRIQVIAAKDFKREVKRAGGDKIITL